MVTLKKLLKKKAKRETITKPYNSFIESLINWKTAMLFNRLLEMYDIINSLYRSVCTIA